MIADAFIWALLVMNGTDNEVYWGNRTPNSQSICCRYTRNTVPSPVVQAVSMLPTG
jgi:hypothetical protein